MPTQTHKEPSQHAAPQQAAISPQQVQQVQEAMRRAEQDMIGWREKSRVDPEKLKKPFTR